jgi:hypothetical protein
MGWVAIEEAHQAFEVVEVVPCGRCSRHGMWRWCHVGCWLNSPLKTNSKLE